MADGIAMAVTLDESVATSIVDATCSVETTGSLTRGQMVIDRPPFSCSGGKVRLVSALDFERLVQLLTAAVAD